MGQQRILLPVAAAGAPGAGAATSHGATGHTGHVLDTITGTQPAPSAAVVAGAAAVAALLVLLPLTWPLLRHVVTITHEGAHGVAALLTGRRLMGIRLHSDTSGLTVSKGRPTGLGMVLTLAAGYPGPALFGLAAAATLAADRSLAVLWGSLVLLALLLLQIRNLFGLWVVLVCGAAVFALTRWAPVETQVAAAYLLTWFLLLAAPRPVLELARERRRRGRRGGTSDPDQLARLTRVPATVWLLLFGLVTVGAAVLGAGLLLPGG